ncbi:HAUS augmin-like complex subunit 2 [Aplochiton taeniatus]
MNPWDSSIFSEYPVANFLSRCVASGVLSQELLDAIPKEPAFSPHLQEVEQQSKLKREIDRINLETELLKLDKESADVTHKFYLSQRFEEIQQFTTHLQDILREQGSLRQRLMKPLCQTNLPVEASLHKYVVEVIKMVVEFIENLETNVMTVRTIPTVEDNMTKLNNGLAQLLAQVADVEKLSKQVLQWREHHSSYIPDSSSREAE